MAAKTSWHKCGTKLRHHHPTYSIFSLIRKTLYVYSANKLLQTWQRPHRCWHLPNNFEILTARLIFPILTKAGKCPPKLPLPRGIWATTDTRFLCPTRVHTQIRHLDRFSRFSTAHGSHAYEQQTDTHRQIHRPRNIGNNSPHPASLHPVRAMRPKKWRGYIGHTRAAPSPIL